MTTQLIHENERCSKCGGSLKHGFSVVPANPNADPETGYRDDDEYVCSECSEGDEDEETEGRYAAGDEAFTMAYEEGE